MIKKIIYYDFGKDIIPFDNIHDEINEDTTQNAILEHGDTDGKMMETKTNRKRKCGSRVTKIKKN